MNKISYEHMLYTKVDNEKKLCKFINDHCMNKTVVVRFIFSFEIDRVESVRSILLSPMEGTVMALRLR